MRCTCGRMHAPLCRHTVGRRVGIAAAAVGGAAVALFKGAVLVGVASVALAPQAQAQPHGMAYCHAVTDAPGYLTVSGPAGGRVAVGGKPAGTLELIDGETSEDSGPYSGVRYNVPAGTVTVDGQPCSR